MNNVFIVVKAKVRLLNPEEGGRSTGAKSGWRPHHVFELPKKGELLNCHSGDIIFEGTPLFLPGETKVVTVRFLHGAITEKLIYKGRKWFIYEVPHRIGEGEILEVL